MLPKDPTERLHKLKYYFDLDYAKGQTVRDKASEDMIFYAVTQWDDQALSETQLSFRGEFNMLRKAGNQILAQLQENPIHPDFQPINETREDAAELMDGLYRKDSHSNDSLEAFQTANNETVICGVGAWKLENEYETNRAGETKQVIKRKPVYEANNNLFWDNNAKRLDKSDARRCTYLHAYSVDGYKQLVHDITGEELDEVNASSFATPNQSYVFPWFQDDAWIYVAEYYYREVVKTKSYVLEDIFGNTRTVSADIADDYMESIHATGEKIIDEREYDRYQVTRILASGNEILEETIVPGEHIPFIPQYGYRWFVEGQETYEGVTRIAMDPQRLRNFQLSYLADIVSRSPRDKPIFGAAQIQGLEHMYELSGADNNYPYLIQHLKTPDGEELPFGPVAELTSQDVPPALMAAIPLTEKAIEDVANPGLPQDISDPDLSGKAVTAIQDRMDMQTSEYLNKHKFAIRRDAEVYASMAADIYDVPRKAIVENVDGSRKEVKTMTLMFDDEMNPVVMNDLSGAEFEVFAEIGQAYTSQKQKTKEELVQLMSMVGEGDPLRNALMLSYTTMMDGSSMEDIRDYAKRQLLAQGIRKPETKEDMEFLQQQAQKTQQPSADEMIGIAENKKADADVINAQTKQQETQVKAFEAETRRAKVEVEAAEAGVNIQNKMADTQNKIADTQGKRIDNVMRFRRPVSKVM